MQCVSQLLKLVHTLAKWQDVSRYLTLTMT